MHAIPTLDLILSRQTVPGPCEACRRAINLWRKEQRESHPSSWRLRSAGGHVSKEEFAATESVICGFFGTKTETPRYFLYCCKHQKMFSFCCEKKKQLLYLIYATTLYNSCFTSFFFFFVASWPLTLVVNIYIAGCYETGSADNGI